jgi:hypothetical protein
MDNTAVGTEAYEHIGDWKIGRLGDLVEVDGDNNGVAVYCLSRQYLTVIMDAGVE